MLKTKTNMKPQKLTEKELETLKEIQTKTNQITLLLGQIEVQKQILEGQKVNILNQFSDLQDEQSKFAKELQEKYGDGNVDISTGEFTSNK